ncbi:MAG: virulence factor SrfC family protein [Rhodospirillaceae bacterium]
MTLDAEAHLTAIAERIARGARQTRTWVKEAQREAEPVAAEAESLIAEARKVESAARRLGIAAARRMCTGVFGASQQGKSYLISVLARPPGEAALRARFGARTYDFLVELNPQGGQESTGIVTRFTTAAVGGAGDAAHPVDLLLLSESDLVKILGNAFQSDFDQNNVRIAVPRGDAIKKTLEEARGAAKPAVVAPHLDEIVVAEIGDYFFRNFRLRWEELERVRYWETVIDLAPRLSRAGRGRLFAPIWGGLDELTGKFLTLVGGLEALGFAAEAAADMTALIPRESSIIDVHTLLTLDGPAGPGTGIGLRARAADRTLAPAVALDRAVVAALVAELRITVDQCPWPMFRHTDLLDFPGAKAREKFVDLDADAEKRFDQVNQLIRRGKVAYLFQRYSDERELTSLLLCHGNKPVDVNDLSPLIRQWLDLSHGPTPAARRRVPTSLFLVLTMMDLEFIAKGGETDESIGEKWDIRLLTSLYDKYKRDGWPEDFNGKPFNNVFLSRNPSFDQVHLVEYALRPGSAEPERPLREVRVLSDRAYFRKLRQSFLASAKVADHIAEPERAWEAMCALNDGGVSYLIERLTGVSDPSLKRLQVETRLSECARALSDTLRRFHHGLDPESRREKETALTEMRNHLVDAFAAEDFRRFGRFLGTLGLEPAEIREITLASPAVQGATPAAAREGAAPKARRNIFESGVTKPAERTAARTDDRPCRFARSLCQRWIARLRRLAQDQAFLEHFGLDGRITNDIFDQMIVAADRLRLADRIADQVREATNLAALRWEDAADRIVIIAESALGAFVSSLDFSTLPLERRPGFPEGAESPERRIFEPPPRVPLGRLPDLGEARVPTEEFGFIDWGIAFLRIGLDNLDYGGGRMLTPELNRRLGDLLADLTAKPGREG